MPTLLFTQRIFKDRKVFLSELERESDIRIADTDTADIAADQVVNRLKTRSPKLDFEVESIEINPEVNWVLLRFTIGVKPQIDGEKLQNKLDEWMKLFFSKVRPFDFGRPIDN